MTLERATVLPFPQAFTARGAERPGGTRAHVRLELTRRGRRLLTVLAFVLGLIVAAVALFAFDIPSALAGEDRAEGVTVTVQSGDTLWGYAEQYAPPGMSETQFVAEVRSLNHLPTGRVTAGQEIQLPVVDGDQRG